jgi:Protein of unknown function (DUF1629)
MIDSLDVKVLDAHATFERDREHLNLSVTGEPNDALQAARAFTAVAGALVESCPSCSEPAEHIIMTSDNRKPVARQHKPRKRYQMNFDYNRQSKRGFLLENRLSMAPDEKALRPPPGRRGFQDYPEAPRFLFDKSAGRLPLDLEEVGVYWLVSDRTKSVFEAVDPAGFAFLACDVRLPSGDYDGPSYWLCDVLRVLDALDERNRA